MAVTVQKTPLLKSKGPLKLSGDGKRTVPHPGVLAELGHQPIQKVTDYFAPPSNS
jgi:hypothetical protein